MERVLEKLGSLHMDDDSCDQIGELSLHGFDLVGSGKFGFGGDEKRSERLDILYR